MTHHVGMSRLAADEVTQGDAEKRRSLRTPVTVVVPTRNESGNIEVLLDRLGVALAGYEAEVLFVDDSDDDTPRIVLEQAEGRLDQLTVRLLHRHAGERAGGLGSAVAAGFASAGKEWVVVMDGDLQHPPEVVPQLIERGLETGADVVVASRHVDGGDSGGLSGLSRVLVSGSATHVAKLLFPVRLRGVTDPMSGFFAMRRDAIDTANLRPDGFKILMEVLVRTRGLSRAEVGFQFQDRLAGESKASFTQGLRFARHLVRLSLSRFSLAHSQRRRVLGFGIVGLTGIVVNSAALWLLADPNALGLHYLVAAILATQVSTTWNFALTDRFVYRGVKLNSSFHRLGAFLLVSNVVLLARVPFLALLVDLAGMNYLLANLLTLFVSFAVRFATSDRLIFRSEVIS